MSFRQLNDPPTPPSLQLLLSPFPCSGLLARAAAAAVRDMIVDPSRRTHGP